MADERRKQATVLAEAIAQKFGGPPPAGSAPFTPAHVNAGVPGSWQVFSENPAHSFPPPLFPGGADCSSMRISGTGQGSPAAMGQPKLVKKGNIKLLEAELGHQVDLGDAELSVDDLEKKLVADKSLGPRLSAFLDRYGKDIKAAKKVGDRAQQVVRLTASLNF